MLKLEATPLIIHPLILLFNKKVESLNNSQDFYYTMKKILELDLNLKSPNPRSYASYTSMSHTHKCLERVKLVKW